MPESIKTTDVTSNISALILAGGRGRRFNHQDKGWLKWQDKALIEHVVERLTPQCDDIVISCNRNQERYASLGFLTVSDDLNDYQGPLAGIAAGLALCQHQWVLIAPCDTPLLPQNLAARLTNTLCNDHPRLVYASDGKRDQYLFALMEKALVEDLRTYLAEDNRSVHGWYEKIGAKSVDFSDTALSFSNVNTRGDLLALGQGD